MSMALAARTRISAFTPRLLPHRRRHLPRGRVVTEDRFPVIIALPEPDATPAPKVDRRDNFHEAHPVFGKSSPRSNVAAPESARKPLPRGVDFAHSLAKFAYIASPIRWLFSG